MKNSEILARWTSIHALRYLEKYEDREITIDRIFEYLDDSKSSILNMLLLHFSLGTIISEFTLTLNDFK
jgi:hypothetical protein